MSNLADFLLERIAETEVHAMVCAEVFPGEWELTERGWAAYVKADAPSFQQVARVTQNQTFKFGRDYPGDHLEHFVTNSPPAVIRRFAALRAIVCNAYDEGDDDWVLRTLALPYDGHSDYREEWRP